MGTVRGSVASVVSAVGGVFVVVVAGLGFVGVRVPEIRLVLFVLVAVLGPRLGFAVVDIWPLSSASGRIVVVVVG